MLLQIVFHTPTWVWALLAALLVLGASQTRDREITPARATVLPSVLLVLSLVGVATSFHQQVLPLLDWAGGLALGLSAGVTWLKPRRARWDAHTGRFHVPGSGWPLVLILALFVLKYGVGVARALHPALVDQPVFGALIGLAYGSFSGLFASRALALWRLRRASPAAVAA
jgi:hypothetical protein